MHQRHFKPRCQFSKRPCHAKKTTQMMFCQICKKLVKTKECKDYNRREIVHFCPEWHIIISELMWAHKDKYDNYIRPKGIEYLPSI